MIDEDEPKDDVLSPDVEDAFEPEVEEEEEIEGDGLNAFGEEAPKDDKGWE